MIEKIQTMMWKDSEVKTASNLPSNYDEQLCFATKDFLKKVNHKNCIQTTKVLNSKPIEPA